MRRLLLVVLSLVPHLYVAGVGLRQAGASRFLFGALAWNLAPVIVGAFAAYSKYRREGVGWLLATLVSSAWAVWVGLLHPTGSTAALIFLFLPLWNLLVVGPIGALVAMVWNPYMVRRATRRVRAR
jgi:hypothetical protein